MHRVHILVVNSALTEKGPLPSSVMGAPCYPGLIAVGYHGGLLGFLGLLCPLTPVNSG